jgi:hypothetical protein
MGPTSDRELLKAVGLSEQAAASLLNKSRQAVNIGLTKSPTYFRAEDLARILNYCQAYRGSAVPDAELYVRTSRSESEATNVLQLASVFALRNCFLSSEAVIDADEVWVTLPEFRYFKTTHPDRLAMLVARAQKDLSNFRLFVSVREDSTEFWKYANIPLESGEKVSITVPQVDALPYFLLLNPNAISLTGWVLVTGGFQRIDGMRTEGVSAFLRNSAEKAGLTKETELQQKENFARTAAG